MAVPKKKTSKSRRNMRRSHDFLKSINYVECQNCGEMKLYHHICSSCGYYNRREVKIIAKSEKTIV
ncbi:MAG: 50S ribosomal protein L32 [Rhodospirillaceae bacterium]|jgi:large subunit ribosomal protein L32|nr:50S ribosomal protein L32 [Rhodospirillaceae bacterium]